MHYATYGRSRHRRVKPKDRGRSGGSLRGSIKEDKSEPYASPRTDAQGRRRRKYKQMRSKSPTPKKKSSASPIKRRVSFQETTEDQKKELVRRARVVKPQSFNERPRQLYQQKQKEFHRQMSGFDFFEEKATQKSELDGVVKSESASSKKPGAKLVKSAKLFFKGKMPSVQRIFISGNTCRRYSYYLQSRFQHDSGSIGYDSYQDNTGTVTSSLADSNSSAASSLLLSSSASSSSSSEECASDEGESTVEIEEVDMMNDDASEKSRELGPGAGSHTETLSSLTYRKDDFKKNEPGSQDDQGSDDQVIKFTKELVKLLDENKSLRGNINDLRREFEAMLKQMSVIAGENESAFGDESSVQSDDSRVSHCLRKIDKLKLEALEKFKEVAENHQDDKDEELAKKEKDIKSFEECIEDLLCENERLFDNVVTLTKEKLDILKEVQILRQRKQEDLASSDASVAASGCTIPHYMLTDEKEAECQHNDLDTIALLLEKMKMSSTKSDNENVPSGVEEDIISLVSKIMTQQHHREGQSRPDLQVVPEIGKEEQEQETSDAGVSLEESGQSSDLKVDWSSDLKEDCGEVPSDEKCDDEDISGTDEDDDKSSSSSSSEGECDDDYISGEDDDDFISSSSCSHSSADDDYEVSADSLLDKRHPSFFPSKHVDDSLSSRSLEVIYEYYSSDSEGSSASASVQSESDHDLDPHYDSEDSQDSDFYDEGDYTVGRRSVGRRSVGRRSFCSFGSIESAEYYFHGDRSTSRSASRTRSSIASRSRARSASRSRSASASRSRSASAASRSRSVSSASRSRSRSSPRSSLTDRVKVVTTRRYSSSSRGGSSQKEVGDVQSTTNSGNIAQERDITSAINSQLDPVLFDKTEKCRTMSTCASISASDSTGSSPTFPSFSSDSTKEHKAIAITVVCRSSKHISFPSTREHTFVTFFTVSMRKKIVDAVLQEQMNAGSNDLYSQNNSSSKKKSKKYKGEFNEDGERHGYGIYTSKNGNQYRGEWQNNKREGLGVVKVGNGDAFEGQFEGNLKNGVGVYHYQDGECDLSRYENDQRVGESLRWSANRQQAFLLTDVPSVKEISLTEAAAIALKMGIVVAY